MDIRREFDVVVQGMHDTHDFWAGDAAEAARERAARMGADAARLARALVAAAVAARDGADVIAAARDDVLGTVAAVQSRGFAVTDDGTVTPPAQPPLPVLATAGGNMQIAQEVLRSGAEEFTREIVEKLDTLGAADDDAACEIDEAFHGVTTPQPTAPTGLDDNPVGNWPAMTQDSIAAQIAAMTPEQRRQLIESYPQQSATPTASRGTCASPPTDSTSSRPFWTGAANWSGHRTPRSATRSSSASASTRGCCQRCPIRPAGKAGSIARSWPSIPAARRWSN